MWTNSKTVPLRTFPSWASDMSPNQTTQLGKQALLKHGPRFQVGVYRTLRAAYNRQVTPACEGLALIDTGAIVSCIDSGTAESLGLPVIDTQGLTPVGRGPVMAPVYAATLTEVDTGKVVNWIDEYAGVDLARWKVIALVGRDILTHGLLKYNGAKGEFSLSFSP